MKSLLAPFRFQIFILIGFASFLGNAPCLFAQEVMVEESVVLLDSAFQIGILSQKTFSHYFREGGTIRFNLEVKEKPIHSVEVYEDPRVFVHSDYEIDKIENVDIEIVPYTRLKFRFRNSSYLKKRYCRVKLERVYERPLIPDTIIVVDTLYDTIRSKVIIFDTVATMVVDARQEISPQYDPTRMPRVAIPIDLPHNTLYWAYWVGVGEEALADYIALQDVMPEDWIREGISSPLIAFGFSKVDDIPGTSLGEKTEYYFADTTETTRFILGMSTRELPIVSKKKVFTDHGKVTLDKTPSNGQVYACITNPNTVTEIVVFLKVAAFVPVRSFEDRDEAVPRFVERKVLVWPEAEAEAETEP
jgi:hypothetical protein